MLRFMYIFNYSIQCNGTWNILLLQLYINWMNFFINLLLPLLIMFVLNLGIYRVLKNLWAAHRTCCMNHRNRQNLITSINQRGRRASMGGKLKLLYFSISYYSIFIVSRVLSITFANRYNKKFIGKYIKKYFEIEKKRLKMKKRLKIMNVYF